MNNQLNNYLMQKMKHLMSRARKELPAEGREQWVEHVDRTLNDLLKRGETSPSQKIEPRTIDELERLQLMRVSELLEMSSGIDDELMQDIALLFVGYEALFPPERVSKTPYILMAFMALGIYLYSLSEPGRVQDLLVLLIVLAVAYLAYFFSKNEFPSL